MKELQSNKRASWTSRNCKVSLQATGTKEPLETSFEISSYAPDKDSHLQLTAWFSIFRSPQCSWWVNETCPAQWVTSWWFIHMWAFSDSYIHSVYGLLNTSIMIWEWLNGMQVENSLARLSTMFGLLAASCRYVPCNWVWSHNCM